MLVLTHSTTGGVRRSCQRVAAVSGDPAAEVQGAGGDDAAAAVGHDHGPRETDAQVGDGRRRGRRGPVRGTNE